MSRDEVRPPDPRDEQRLRDALRARAEHLQPRGDGLALIRARTDRARPGWLRPLAALASVALVAGGVAAGVALSGNDTHSRLHVIRPAGTPTNAPTSPAPTGSATPVSDGHPVPVYYLHDTGVRLALYREFHRFDESGLTAGSDARVSDVEAAVTLMLRNRPADPDYSGVWPAGITLRDASVSGAVVTVDLQGDLSGFSTGAEAEALSLQQLVWTATAAAQVPTMRLLVDGQPVQQFGDHVAVGSAPIARDPAIQVLGPIWIEQPVQGAEVSSPVTVSGEASVFEGTLAWQVLGSDGTTVVQRGSTQASSGAPERGSFSFTVSLPAGSYTVRCFENSAKDGSVINVDDKAITVR
jgi:spore germination protein GerM